MYAHAPHSDDEHEHVEEVQAGVEIDDQVLLFAVCPAMIVSFFQLRLSFIKCISAFYLKPILHRLDQRVDLPGCHYGQHIVRSDVLVRDVLVLHNRHLANFVHNLVADHRTGTNLL